MSVASGPSFLPELRAAVAAAPDATRFVIGPGEIPADLPSAPDAVLAVGISISDTCKEVAGGLVRRTIPRETLVDLTGPWLFTRAALNQALEHSGPGASPQNPLQLCRAAGLRIRVLAKA